MRQLPAALDASLSRSLGKHKIYRSTLHRHVSRTQTRFPTQGNTPPQNFETKLVDDSEYCALLKDAQRKILAIEAVDTWRSIGVGTSLLGEWALRIRALEPGYERDGLYEAITG